MASKRRWLTATLVALVSATVALPVPIVVPPLVRRIARGMLGVLAAFLIPPIVLELIHAHDAGPGVLVLGFGLAAATTASVVALVARADAWAALLAGTGAAFAIYTARTGADVRAFALFLAQESAGLFCLALIARSGLPAGPASASRSA